MSVHTGSYYGDRRSPVLVLSIGMIVASATGACIPFLFHANLSWGIALIVMGFTAATLLISAHILTRNHPELGLLNPSIILLSYLGLLYVLRPGVVLFGGIVGTPMMGQAPLTSMSNEYLDTLLVISIATCAFALAYLMAPTVRVRWLSRTTSRVPHAALSQRLAMIGIASLLPSLLVLADLRAYPEGWQAALTVRHQFFEGRNYLVWVMQLYRLAFFIWLVFALKGSTVKQEILRAVILWTPALLFDLLSGSRGELILRNLLPVAAIFVFSGSRPTAGFRSFTLILVVSLAIFVVYRTVVRDVFVEASGASPLQAVANNVVGLPSYLLDEDEASAFDYLILVRGEVPSHYPFSPTGVIFSAVMAPVPSAVAPNKPLRTGTLLTKELLPETYRKGGNIAFSGAADFYLMAGDVAIILGFAALGLVAGSTIKSIVKGMRDGISRQIAVALGFVAVAAFLTLVRVDLFETLFVPVRLLMFVGVYFFLTQEDGQAREAP